MNESEARSGNTSYNRIAGQSVERLAAVSDGIFAVAMTLLVLDLHDPARESIHSEQDPLARACCNVSPIHHLPDEFSYAGHLLERSAGAAEPLHPDQPAPHLDSPGVSFRSFCYAVFDEATGRLH